MACAAKVNQDSFPRSPQEARDRRATADRSSIASKASIYDIETEQIGYNIAEYYAFTREEY